MRIKFIISMLLCLPLIYQCSGEQNLNGALMVNPRGQIEITPTQGEAYVFNAGMVGSPKALLLEGASIQTGNESYVDLQFQTRVSLRVGPNSKLKLRESKIVLRDNESRVLLDLQSGRLFSRSDRLESNSRIVVRTPTVVAAVRGTEFLIIEEDQSELMVNEGAVEVTPPEKPPEVIEEPDEEPDAPDVPDAPEEPADEPEVPEDSTGDVIDEGNKIEVDESGETDIQPLDEEDQAEIEEMSDGLEYVDPTGLDQIQSIMETFEEQKQDIRDAFDEQKDSDRQMMDEEKARMQDEFQQQKDEIRGNTGNVQDEARDQLDRIRQGQ